MARNEEKAQSMLHRYLRSKQTNSGGESRYDKRRPYLTTLCDDVDEAIKWHAQVNNDIRRRVDEIQNPGLDEERTRELNDQINKFLRERKHWRRRIEQLGGQVDGSDIQYGRRKKKRRKRKRYDDQQHEDGDGDDDDDDDGVFEYDGYMYFGNAKTLPGVKQLIDAEKEEKNRKNKNKNGDGNNNEDDDNEELDINLLNSKLNSFYYGDDIVDDTYLKEIEKEEKDYQPKIMNNSLKQWEEKIKNKNDEYKKQFDKDSDWDESYLQFVNTKRLNEIENENEMKAILLDKKKSQALQLLEQGMNYQ